MSLQQMLQDAGLDSGSVQMYQDAISMPYLRDVTPSMPSLGTPFDDLYIKAGRATGIPARVLAAVGQAESGHRPSVVSPAGAIGVMQLMPSTAKSLGVDPYDPGANIMGGAKYLKKLLDRYGGDYDKAFAAYNAGPGNVDRYGGIPPFKETQRYVGKLRKSIPTTKTAPTVNYNFGKTFDAGDFSPNTCGKYARAVISSYGWKGKSIYDLQSSKYASPVKDFANLAPGDVVHLQPKGKGTTTHWAVVMRGEDGQLKLNELITTEKPTGAVPWLSRMIYGQYNVGVSTGRPLANVYGRIDQAYRPRYPRNASTPVPEQQPGLVDRFTNFMMAPFGGTKAAGRAGNEALSKIMQSGKAVDDILAIPFGGTTSLGKAANTALTWGANALTRSDKTDKQIADSLRDSKGNIDPFRARSIDQIRWVIQNSGIDALMLGAGNPGKYTDLYNLAKNEAERLQQVIKGQEGKLSPQALAFLKQRQRNTVHLMESYRDAAAIAEKNAVKPPPSLGSTFNKIIASRQAVEEMEQHPASVLNVVTEALAVPRTIMASMDLSAPFRQGIGLIGETKQWGQSFGRMFKFAFSEDAYKKGMDEIANHPAYDLMKRSGLDLPGVMGRTGLAGREEAFMGQMAEKIPGIGHGIRGSDRAFTGFLNNLRAGVFTKYYDAWGEEAGEETYKALANTINTLSGRGSLGALEQAAPQLANIFWSPRLFASRVEMPFLAMQKNPKARMVAIKNLTAMVGAGMSLMGMAKLAGFEVGTDPTSADFGKIKIGQTQIEPFGGETQFVRRAAQIIYGQKTNQYTGRQTPNSWKDQLVDLLRSKLAPVPGVAMDIATGSTITGQPIERTPEGIGKRIGSMGIPLIAQDVYDAATTYKNPKAAIPAAGIASLFGLGTQTYSPFDQVNMNHPGSKAYWETRMMVAQTAKTPLGMSEPTDNQKSAALWRTRRALFEDKNDVAAKEYAKYTKLGGTVKGATNALKRAHPLAGIPKNQQQMYVDSLTGEEIMRLSAAIGQWNKAMEWMGGQQ